MQLKWVRLLFAVAAVYDGALGLAFLFFAPTIFHRFSVTPPNHMGYIDFPALLLILFGVMFWNVARDPIRNHNLILYGAGLKVAYAGVAFWYEVNGGIPALWIPWAWIDLLFLILFLVTWARVRTALR